MLELVTFMLIAQIWNLY